VKKCQNTNRYFFKKYYKDNCFSNIVSETSTFDYVQYQTNV